MIGVVPGVFEIHSGDEAEAGLGALEMEAIGLQPTRACELINDFLVGGVVGCREERVKIALQQLYKIAGYEMEFLLEELGDLDISPPTFDQGTCAEMEARRLVFLARQSKSRGASHVRH